MKHWREYFTTLFVAVVLALLVRNYLITAYKVPTGSMQPTLKSGDFIFSSRISFGFHLPFSTSIYDPGLPERGDVVVFSYEKRPDISYVKRVVALPGDKVQMDGGRLILNDQAVSYIPVENSAGDNPNPEIFSLFDEKLESSSHRVIFRKEIEDKQFGPVIVPPGEVFLLGDNRDASDDSRYWGTVPLSRVTGRVTIVWLSLDWQKKWGGERYPSVRWNRVFSSVH